MQRHERLGRTYTRAAAAGIMLSVAAHAAVLALVQSDVPGAGEEGAAAAAAAPETPEMAQVVKKPVMQVVALREVDAADAAAPSSPTMPAPEAAAQAGAPAAPAPAVAMAEVVDVPAAALPLAGPEAAPGGAPLAGEPAEAAARPDALRPEPAEAGDAEEYELPAGVTLYDPGSVGRAKGKWAGAAGGHELEGRRRAIVVVRPGRDGRKCPPLPGRFWLRGGARNHAGHPPGH